MAKLRPPASHTDVGSDGLSLPIEQLCPSHASVLLGSFGVVLSALTFICGGHLNSQ